MANVYTSISIANPISDISAALLAKYGASLTIHYETTAYLIFSSPILSTKVLEIYYTVGKFVFYYGDSWATGSTIVNQQRFSGSANYGYASAIHLVLGDNYLLFNCLTSNLVSQLTIVGTLTNGQEVALGYSASTNSSYGAGQLGFNISTGESLSIPTLLEQAYGPDGKVFKQPIVFVETSSRVVILNPDGTFATLPGLYTCSHVTTDGGMFVTVSAYFSTQNMYHSTGSLELKTCLMADL